MLRASDSIAIAAAHPERLSAAHRNNIPPGFRQGCGEHAVSIAEKIREFSATSCETILQMASWIQEARLHLNRKEFASFVRDLLEWLGSDALDALPQLEAVGFSDTGEKRKANPV